MSEICCNCSYYMKYITTKESYCICGDPTVERDYGPGIICCTYFEPNTN